MRVCYGRTVVSPGPGIHNRQVVSRIEVARLQRPGLPISAAETVLRRDLLIAANQDLIVVVVTDLRIGDGIAAKRRGYETISDQLGDRIKLIERNLVVRIDGAAEWIFQRSAGQQRRKVPTLLRCRGNDRVYDTGSAPQLLALIGEE